MAKVVCALVDAILTNAGDPLKDPCGSPDPTLRTTPHWVPLTKSKQTWNQLYCQACTSAIFACHVFILKLGISPLKYGDIRFLPDSNNIIFQRYCYFALIIIKCNLTSFTILIQAILLMDKTVILTQSLPRVFPGLPRPVPEMNALFNVSNSHFCVIVC